METAACLAARNLGSEGHIETVLVGKVTDDPFGEDELVGCILHVGHQKFNLILLINLIVEGEVAHLGVAVLDQTAHLRDIEHALGAELLKLGEGGRFMITFLVGGEIQLVFVANHIILQFAHGLEIVARNLLKGFDGLAENIFGRIFHRKSVLIEV